MTLPFAVRKFLTLLPASVFASAVWYFVDFAESSFAGNLLTDKALSALSLIAPLHSTILFINQLIASGTSIRFSLAMGRADVRRAKEYITQGFILSLSLTIPFALFIRFFAHDYLAFFGADESVTILAAKYLSWFYLVPISEGLLQLAQSLICAEGDIRRYYCAFCVFVITFLSLTYFGITCGFSLAACSAATVIAEFIALLILLTHLFAKSNNLGLVRHCSFSDARKIVSTSFGDAAARLCTALLIVLITKLVVFRFGSEMLPILQIVILLLALTDLFEGIGASVQPLVTVYQGEDNPRGVRLVMRSAIVASLVLSGAVVLVLETFPTLVGRLLGLSDPVLIAESAHAVRIFVPFIVAMSLAGLFNSYYMCIEHSLWAILVSVFAYFLFPLAAALVGSVFAADGLWFGLAAGVYLGLGSAALAILLRSKRGEFPLLLNRRRERRITSYTLRLSDESVVGVSTAVAELLKRRGADALRASLLIEEALLVIRDRNAPKSVLAEVTVERGAELQITLRDDGEIFDLTDADAEIKSLRGFVVASLMEKQLNRLNLITTGFNRNVFRSPGSSHSA